MRLFFLLSSLLLCFISSGQNQYQALVLDENLTKNANAVVRLDEKVIDIPSINEMIVKTRRIVTVLNEKGNKHVHSYVWYDDSRRVKTVVAIIYDSFGNELEKIKEKDFNDVSSVDGGTLYSDSRVKYISYTPTQYPYTVEFISEITTSNTAYVPSWYFIDNFSVSVEKSKFLVRYDNTVGIITKEENFVEGIKNNSKEGLLQYEAENLKAIKSESLSPDFSDIVPLVKIAPKNFNYEGYRGSTSSWEEIGKWMYDKLLADRTVLTEATINKVKELVAGIDNPIEKARKVYRYVQGNTRYISVQEGIGGIQPIAASEVDRVKYGDCKGLTNYTKALLDVVGVKSNYTRVYASPYRQRSMDRSFPTFLGQSNHVILNIPVEGQETIWLECTSQTIPFGFLGDFTDNRDVFVVTSEGGQIVRTPSYTNTENHQKTLARYRLDDSGSISADVILSTKGLKYNKRYYLKEIPQEKVVQEYKEHWSNINNLKIEKYHFEDNQEDVVFKEKVDLKATDYASKSGNRILFKVNAFNHNSYVPNRYRNRKLPFEIQRGFFDEDEFEVQLPEGYVVEALPSEKTLDTEFGTYKVSFKSDTESSIVFYKRSLLIKKGNYPKEKYKAYRDFRKEIARTDAARIVLLKK